MKLFYAPGACSIGIHVILEEIGCPYELQKLDLRAGEQLKEPFASLNPKGKVPTLVRDDGRVITEYPVIAQWLACTFAEAKLLPEQPDERLEAESAVNYCVSTIHMQGFARLFRPSNFSPSEADAEAVKAKGKEIVAKGFDIMARMLEGKDWVAGSYSIADATLFYVEWWARARMSLPVPPALSAHLDRMMARPAVQRALQQEGLAG